MLPLPTSLKQLTKAVLVPAFERRAISRLSRSENGSAARLARAIRNAKAAGSEPLLKAIERRRQELDARTDRLADGHLGPPGPFDGRATVGDASRVSSKPEKARLIYSIIREWRPATVLELGTNVGISSAYIGTALHQNGGGELLTLEASPYRLKIAQELHQLLGLDNITYRQGLFSSTLPSALHELSAIEVAFIDGHHHYQPTLDYFDQVWRHSTDAALFIFDDIHWSMGMLRAWWDLQRDERIAIAADLPNIGLCITHRDRGKR